MKKLLSAIFAGIVSVAAAGDFAASFEPGLKGWDVKNMSGAVDIRAGVYKGEKALIVSGLPGKNEMFRAVKTTEHIAGMQKQIIGHPCLQGNEHIRPFLVFAPDHDLISGPYIYRK